MKLQSVRIKAQDYPEDQKELAEKLGETLNPFIDRLLLGFNKNITVEDNLPFEFKTLDIAVDSSGNPLTKTTLTTTLKTFKGFICINVLTTNNTSKYPLSTPFISTTVNSNIITINNITGLTANTTYRLVLLAIS